MGISGNRLWTLISEKKHNISGRRPESNIARPASRLAGGTDARPSPRFEAQLRKCTFELISSCLTPPGSNNFVCVSGENPQTCSCGPESHVVVTPQRPAGAGRLNNYLYVSSRKQHAVGTSGIPFCLLSPLPAEPPPHKNTTTI